MTQFRNHGRVNTRDSIPRVLLHLFTYPSNYCCRLDMYGFTRQAKTSPRVPHVIAEARLAEAQVRDRNEMQCTIHADMRAMKLFIKG